MGLRGPIERGTSLDTVVGFQTALNEQLHNLESSSKDDKKVDGVCRKVLNNGKSSSEGKLPYVNCLGLFEGQDKSAMKKVLGDLDKLSKKHSGEKSHNGDKEKREIEAVKKDLGHVIEKTWTKCTKEDEILKSHPFKRDDKSPETVLNFFHNKLKHNILEKRLCKLEALEHFLNTGRSEA